MKIYRKDKKLGKQIRKLSVIKQLKHNELLKNVDLPIKSHAITFDKFEINDMILKALNSMNLTHATDIQSKILPNALNFVDIIASEKTGSGKTLSYLIPLLNSVLKFRFRAYHGTCAIVLVPTKELCIQVCSVFNQLSQFSNVKFGLIHGDAVHKDEESLLGNGCTVLFATPNSLFHHMKCSKANKDDVEYFRYHNLKFLVLDEADRLLEDSYKKTIENILENLPFTKQTMILSATLNLDGKSVETIKKFAKKSLSPGFFSVNISFDKDVGKSIKNATVDNLTEGYVILPANKRIKFLYSLIKATQDKKVMIFFSSSEEVEFYYSFLSLLSISDQSLLMLHSSLTSDTRTSNLIKFNNLKSGFLLCTDVVSRGIDIPEVSLVIQFDVPSEPTGYIHRVGRTARGGLEGTAIILLRENEADQILNNLKNISISLIEFETPDLVEIEDLYQMLPKSSQLFRLAERALIAQLLAYKNSELIQSIKHIKLEDELINFCLQATPALPKILKSEFE